MNKKFIRLLGTVAVVFTLAACDKTVTKEISRDPYVAPEELRLNFYSLGLLAGGEGRQLEPKVFPTAAGNSNKVTYKSSNTSIAKVSKSGVVTGVKGGATTITVSVGEGDDMISQEIPVYVASACTEKEANAYAKEQLAMQESYGRPEAIQVHEVRNNFSLIDGVSQRGYIDDCVYTISETEGFIDFTGFEERQKAPEGDLEPLTYGWTFFTDEDYITNLYHISDSTKNRMSLPTQSYIGRPRIEAVYDLINMIFTNAKKALVDQNYDTVYETNNLSDISGGKDYGRYKDNDLNIVMYSFRQSGIDTIDPDSESNTEIPSGTRCNIRYSADLCFVNGVCVAEYVDQVMTYTVDNIKWTRNTTISYENKINDDVELVYPNNKDYSEVDDLYDL